MSSRRMESQMRSGLPAAAGTLLVLAALTGGCDGADSDESQADQPRENGEEATSVVGTFKMPDAPIDPQGRGRLPAEGDLAAYVPASALFPGAARIDPEVSNPYSGNPDAVAAGKRHFAAFNCAGCHAPLGGGGMGPPLSDDAWIYGSEPGQIYLTILHGRPDGMPAWGSMLPQRTIWELVTYIKTLPDIEEPSSELGFDSKEIRTARTGGETQNTTGSGGR